MAEKKKEEEAEGGEQKAAKPKSKKMLFIIIGVVLLLGGGGGAFFYISSANKAAEEAAKQEEEVHPRELKRIKLDPFVVNLSEAKSFLKVSILLEYDPEVLARVSSSEGGGSGHGGGAASEGGEGGAGEGMPPQIAEKEPILRDKIIAVLSSKTPPDVLSVTGKQALKDEIIEAVNDTLEFPEPVVVGVYFTEFMIQ